jgi:hypothetical protein
MTLNPNDAQPVRDQEPMRVEKAPNGLYSVKNAYSGDYEYFKGRPLPKITPEKTGTK